MSAHDRPFTIDPEFKAFLPQQSPDERKILEANLVAEGCRDPLVAWKEEKILLDGHNRLDICEKHNIAYKVIWQSFPDRAAAMEWMAQHQLGRRNLPDALRRYYLGKEYLAAVEQEKKAEAAAPKEKGKPRAKRGKTSEKVAARNKTTRRTVERAARFAKAVDQAAAGDAAKKAEILKNPKEAKKAAPARPAKKFDGEKFRHTLGTVIREIDKYAAETGTANGPSHKLILKACGVVAKTFDAWQKKVSAQKSK
ncbi:MAG TPA: hypothetical protein VM529_15945 [Gemmata sp.]|nr:hypothetical protein [Gemmata sp.]